MEPRDLVVFKLLFIEQAVGLGGMGSVGDAYLGRELGVGKDWVSSDL